MEEILMNIDPKMLYLAGGVLILIVVLSIIMKALKIAAIAAVIAVAFLFFGPKVTDIQDQYNIAYENETLTLTIDGKNTLINASALKTIEVVTDEAGNSFIVYVQDGEENSIKIPSYMTKMAESILENIISEQTGA